LSRNGPPFVPSHWLGLFIDNGFDSVAIRINNESGEIVRSMLWMKAHASVVLSAVGQRRLMKNRRRVLRRGSEGEMKPLTRSHHSLLTKANSKLILSTGLSVADRRFFAASAALLSKSADITKWSENGVIKTGGPREISHSEGKMMQHEQMTRAGLPN
jgi:hypothetical protein